MSALKQGDVLYFSEPSFSTGEPHYFVVINFDPAKDTVVVLACASSRVSNAQLYIQDRSLPMGSVVEVDPSEYKHFSKPTVFNCNTPLVKDTKVFTNVLKRKNIKPFPEVMPAEIVQKLCAAVAYSPMVERKIQKLFFS